MEEKVLDFTKIKCKQHPFETVTNYCLNQKCMIGLCSMCVCLHTEMHMRDGSMPVYKPLKDVHKMAFDCIHSHMKLLEYDKERVVNVMKNLTDRRQNFRRLLSQAKKDILNLVQRVFEEAQVKFQQQVKIEEKRTGLHSVFQIQSLCRKVNREIDHLLSQAQHLNTSRMLDVVKNIKVNALNQVQKVHEEVTKQIIENQQFIPALNYKKQSLFEVQVVLRRLFSLSFMYPRTNCLTITQKVVRQAGKENVVIVQRTVENKPFFNLSNANLIKTAPTAQQSLRNSKIFENTNLSQKPHRASSNLTRSGSFSNMSLVPQFLDTKNFPFQLNTKSNTTGEFKLTGSKVFTQFLGKR